MYASSVQISSCIVTAAKEQALLAYLLAVSKSIAVKSSMAIILSCNPYIIRIYYTIDTAFSV